MSLGFKIYFKDKGLEKKVLVKGDFLKYQWDKLKMTIIENSKKGEFKSLNKEIKIRDDFILEFLDLPKNFKFPLQSIWSKKTFTYLVENLKSYMEKNPNEEIKLRLALSKVDKLPKWDPPKYDTFLQQVLENTWKHEEEKIKSHLNDFELTNAQNNFLRKNYKDSNDKSSQIKNDNVICNLCLSVDFFGRRYVCTSCNNYNLCQNCFNLGEHNLEHNFILLKKPVKDDDITKYNNKFCPSNHVLRNIFDPFEISFKVANLGEKDLKNCYITYINFNGNYLWSEKYILNDSFGRNETKEIKLKIQFKNVEDKNGIFEGQFRMFNENGIPFGDIIKVRVKNEKV